MKLEVIHTKDGSATVFNEALNATYHSRHGAIQESIHVFIEAGLKEAVRRFGKELKVLEMGFGTGLNALLTATEVQAQKLNIHYTGIERYPLSAEIHEALNYGHKPLHDLIFNSPWDKETEIVPGFYLTKQNDDIACPCLSEKFHAVYFDAFAPSAMPELWSVPVFENLFSLMVPGACLTTFCAKGEFKRTLKQTGFEVESLPGPVGKREMVRAMKPMHTISR